MDLIKPDKLYNIFKEEFKRIIRGINISLEIKVTNKHSIFKLCNGQFFSGSKNKTPLDDIDPLTDDTIIQFSDIVASKGILSYEVQDDNDWASHYLVITWAVKTFIKRGKNSVTVNILQNPPDKKNKHSLYDQLHADEKKIHPGENINPINPYYRISGGISDGSNAVLHITLNEY